jgi:hypothetical protein
MLIELVTPVSLRMNNESMMKRGAWRMNAGKSNGRKEVDYTAWSRRRGREHPDVAGYVTSSSRDPNYCTNSISPSFPNICYEGIDHTLNRNANLVENSRQRRWMAGEGNSDSSGRSSVAVH